MAFRMAAKQPRQQIFPQHPQSGFSLVEVLVAAALLAISASAAVTLFSTSQVMFSQGKERDDDQNAINADLAEIERRNRRFTCLEGSCTLSGSDPNEDQYTPAHPGVVPPGATFDAQVEQFANLCVQPAGRASGLLEAFKTSALDTLPAMTRRLTRSYDITTASSDTPATPHAYVVRYSKDGQVLRRVRLVPTVAGWCP
ncbi:MAG: hypothetical protein RLZZ468_686 [Cyanobacteriota bacterium]|jgi:prepilin-type N-terminal cleavage/methylation domain-containing protein